MMMLTEICQYLHNYFDRDRPKFYGKFEISDGVITSFNDGDMGMKEGMYFRILGSLLNDGVHQYPDKKGLKDESFDGAIWFCAIPPTVIALSKDISDWQEKHGRATSEAMSPYNSESFGGYSYSKSSGGSGESGGNAGWQSAFAYRLNPWRKLP